MIAWERAQEKQCAIKLIDIENLVINVFICTKHPQRLVCLTDKDKISIQYTKE